MPHMKDMFKIDDLSVLYTNADCLCNKFDECSAKISERNLHIIDAFKIQLEKKVNQQKGLENTSWQ